MADGRAKPCCIWWRKEGRFEGREGESASAPPLQLFRQLPRKDFGNSRNPWPSLLANPVNHKWLLDILRSKDFRLPGSIHTVLRKVGVSSVRTWTFGHTLIISWFYSSLFLFTNFTFKFNYNISFFNRLPRAIHYSRSSAELKIWCRIKNPVPSAISFFREIWLPWRLLRHLTVILWLQSWAKEMALSWEKVSAWLQQATAGQARLVLSKTFLFFCTRQNVNVQLGVLHANVPFLDFYYCLPILELD